MMGWTGYEISSTERSGGWVIDHYSFKSLDERSRAITERIQMGWSWAPTENPLEAKFLKNTQP